MTKPNTKEFDYPKIYLGDGVYALFDGYGIWLYANDYNYPSDRIYLEPDVLAALNKFYYQEKIE